MTAREQARAGSRVLARATDDRVARIAWSRLCEPGDQAAAALVDAYGAREALTWAVEHMPVSTAEAGPGRPVEGPPPAHSPVGVPQGLRRPLARWAQRLPVLDLDALLSVLERVRGSVVVPGDREWPGGLDDLGAAAPLCLWTRGNPDLRLLLEDGVAVVGSRACTEYGSWVAGSLSADLADAGRAVVSGGAYGIDAAAHRGALAARGPTVAFLAGGVDRLYPAGNARLLQSVIAQGGSVVSELPPGSIPSKHRFLQRNRLIAAGTSGTVVVEAARRSGALATAHRASALLRPLAAVPGPVTSAVSSGCHELIREGEAVCVTSAAEVLELLGPVTGERAEPSTVADPRAAARRDVSGGPGGIDGRVCDALPVRGSADAESIARVAGLALAETLPSLGRLELRGIVRRTGGSGWQLAEP